MQKDVAIGHSQISRALTLTNDRLAEVETSLSQLEVADKDLAKIERGGQDDAALTVAQRQEEFAGLQASHAVLQELLSRLEAEAATAQAEIFPVSFGTHNNFSGMQIGVNRSEINIGGMSFGNK